MMEVVMLYMSLGLQEINSLNLMIRTVKALACVFRECRSYPYHLSTPIDLDFNQFFYGGRSMTIFYRILICLNNKCFLVVTTL